MKRAIESEADLRRAFQRAYSVGDGYPDQAVVGRIAAGVHTDRSQSGSPRWAVSVATALAVIAAGLVVILTMLSIPRGTTPAARPSAKPTASRTFVKPWALGFGVGDGTITFVGHDLPPNAKVDITVHQGSVSEEFFAASDGQGNAHATVPVPAALAPGAAAVSICVEPSKDADGAWKCASQWLEVPKGGASVPAPTPSCPAGTRETYRSTPGPNGSFWLGCLGSISTSAP